MLKIHPVFLLLAAAVFIGCQASTPTDDIPSQAAISPEAATAEVEQIFLGYASDWDTQNLEKVFAVLSDDVIQMQPDTTIIGKDALTGGWQTYLANNDDTWEPTIEDIQAAGNLVFITAHFTETATPKAGGDTNTTVGEGVWVFQRESGAWKLVLEQWFDREPDV